MPHAREPPTTGERNMHVAALAQGVVRAVRVVTGLRDADDGAHGVYRMDAATGVVRALPDGLAALAAKRRGLDPSTRRTLASLEREFSRDELRGAKGVFLVYTTDGGAMYAHCCAHSGRVHAVSGLCDGAPMVFRSLRLSSSSTPVVARHGGESQSLVDLPPLADVSGLRWQTLRLPSADDDAVATDRTPAYLTSTLVVVVPPLTVALPDDASALRWHDATIAHFSRRSFRRCTAFIFQAGCAESAYPSGSPIDRCAMFVDTLYRALRLLPSTTAVSELRVCLFLALVRALRDDIACTLVAEPVLDFLRATVGALVEGLDRPRGQLEKMLCTTNVVRLEREAVDLLQLFAVGLGEVCSDDEPPMFLHVAMAFHAFFMPTLDAQDTLAERARVATSTPYLTATFFPHGDCSTFGCVSSPCAAVRARPCDSCAQITTLRCASHASQPFVCSICAELFATPATLREHAALREMNQTLLRRVHEAEATGRLGAARERELETKASALADELFASKSVVAELRGALLTQAEASERECRRARAKPSTASVGTASHDLSPTAAHAVQTDPPTEAKTQTDATQTDAPPAVALVAAATQTDASQTDAPPADGSPPPAPSLEAIEGAMRRLLVEDRAHRERVEQLRTHLAAWGVVRERDCAGSALCAQFEAGTPIEGYATADAIAREMAHLKFLHECTDYPVRAQSLSPAEREALKRQYMLPAVFPWLAHGYS